jgi:hypothetical protein
VAEVKPFRAVTFGQVKLSSPPPNGAAQGTQQSFTGEDDGPFVPRVVVR